MIEAKNLTKTYIASSGIAVNGVEGVSLAFPSMGMVFLLGKSGSGKSTLLHLLGGLDSPSSGELIVDGRSSVSFAPRDYDYYRNTYVGFVFQEVNLIDDLNVYENVALALELQGKKAERSEIMKALERVELIGLADRKTSELSGGQKQRVAIARALVKNPQVILADEPTGALDSETGRVVFSLLKELSKEKLVIVASHDKESAERFGDRIIELRDAHVVKDSSPLNDVMGSDVTYKAKKSRLPIKAATKIAFSSLQKRKFKFLSSVLLAGLSFSMFGLFASLMSYSDNELLSRALLASDVAALPVSKVANGAEYKKAVFDTYGQEMALLDDEANAGRAQKVLFTDADVTHLSSKGVEAAGVFIFPRNQFVSCDGLELEEPLDVYYSSYNYGGIGFVGFSDCGADFCSRNFKLEAGSYPQNADEIAISSFKADALALAVDSNGRLAFDSREEIVGSTLALLGTGEGPSTRLDVKVTGIYKTNDLPSRYDSLKTFPGYLDSGLSSEFNVFKKDSFMDVAFVSDDFYDAYVGCYDYDVRRPEAAKSYEKTLYSPIEATPFTSKVYQAHSYVRGVVPAEFLAQYPDVFDVYDLDGNPLKKVELKDGEVLVPKEWKKKVAKMKHGAMASDLYAFKQMSHITGDVSERLPLAYFSPDAYDEFYSDSFQSRFRAYNQAIDQIDQEGETQELLSAYEFFDAFVQRYWGECAKRKSLFKDIKEFGYSNEERYDLLDDDFKAILAQRLSESDTALFKEIYSEITSVESAKVSDQSEEWWQKLESFMSAHYNETIGTYQALNRFWASMMPYNWAQETVDKRGLPNREAALGIAKRINDKYDGDYEILLDRLKAGEVTNADLDDITACITLCYANSAELADYEYGHFLERAACSKNLDIGGEDAETVCKVVGFISEDEYYIAANAATLKSLSIKMSNGSSISLVLSDYSYTNEGKYDAILSPSRPSPKIVEALREAFPTYSYCLQDRITDSLSAQFGFMRIVKLVAALVGIVFGFLSSFLLLNCVLDSIKTKKKEIGILRSLGASTSDIFKTFALESLFLGLISSIIANIVGWLLVFWVNSSYVFDGVNVTLFDYGPLVVIAVFGASLLISSLASMFPILNMCRKNTIDVIKE